MAEKLTPEQALAVSDRGGRLLVSAAAGSGKTKVLVDRLLSYLTDEVHPANIDDFLMITYTKAAAAELRGKIAAKLTERVAQQPENLHLQHQLQRLYLAKISTVHAFCGEILREYAYTLALPGDFRVADENECGELRAQVMESVLLRAYAQQDGDFCTFVDSQGFGRDDRQVGTIVLQVYDSARCHLDPQAWLTHCLDSVRSVQNADPAQTQYGRFLLERLHNWLEKQIAAMETCAQRAFAAQLDKVGALLTDTVTQLKKLDAARTWQQVAQAKDVDFGRMNFPRSFEDAELKAGIGAVRDACKKGLKKQLAPFADSAEQVLSDMGAAAGSVRGLIALVEDFARTYDDEKKKRRILDFGDLEHKTLDLLLGKSRSGRTAAAREIAGRFREVLVDEYQDSNAVQDAIYNALTAERSNLFLVGDVKQSIYQFRLADPQIFLDKYRAFRPAQQAEAGEDRKVVLSRNFRSGGAVLEACNDVFRQCMSPSVGGMDYGEAEALYEGLPHIPLNEPEVELHCLQTRELTYPEEAAFVAAHIREMLRSGTVRDGDRLRPVRPEDIVILLRAPGSAGGYFQKELERLGIRYATGGGEDLLKTEEIETFYALLQTVYNPRQDIPLVAVMLSPVFGFTADELAALRSRSIRGGFYEAVCGDESAKSRAFVQTLNRLRDAMGKYSLTKLLDRVLTLTELEEVYGARDDGARRLENIQTFYQLAVAFEAAGNRDLGRFLEHLRIREEKGLLTAEGEAGGCVSIMSIHKAKGLEFPVVYLCNLGREFNMESRRANVLCHKQMGLGLSTVDHQNRLRYPTLAKRAISAKIGEECVSEELRVLYVAMTRPRDRLIMTYASKRLEKDLTDMTQRINMGSAALLAEEARCPGDWVLLTALQKTEAGALFALSGKTAQTQMGRYPWKITVQTETQSAQASTAAQTAAPIPETMAETLENGLHFCYAHSAAVSAPSKLTATGLKGRYQDTEAAEQTPYPANRYPWREPGFAAGGMAGKDYGNAMHTLMQYLDFAACTDVTGVCGEIRRLRAENRLSDPQAEAIRPQDVADFFNTDMGQKLRRGKVVREFKFSVLCDAEKLDPALAGERFLLQGVVDCALIEPDGITVIDFKTDRVTERTLPEKVVAYTMQVSAYADAMARIFEMPVKESLLYFFHLGQFVKVC